MDENTLLYHLNYKTDSTKKKENNMASTAAIAIPKALTKSVILFPGQGSQFVGMVKNLTPKGRALFDMANEVLGYDLLSMCQNGPEEDLNKTVHSQPAIFVSSLAAVERLADMSIGAVEKCKATAGFSIGEFAALVLAQSIDFVDALKLIKLRAEVTQAICDSSPSGMMTLICGRDGRITEACSKAREFCVRSGLSRDESVCSVANHLFPHAKVVGGHQVALDFIEKNGKDFGIKRMKRLGLAGAFHTQIMRPAGTELKNALAKMKINDPKIRVYSNLDATVYQDAEQIRKSIVKHVSHPVMWETIMHEIYFHLREGDEFPVTFECGPQNNMTTMLGMVNLKAKKLSYNIEP